MTRGDAGALVALLALACSGCLSNKRVANLTWLLGGYTGVPQTSQNQQGVFGGVSGKFEGAVTEDGITLWGHADAALAGNENGTSGQLSGEGELGVVLFDEPHHFFARAGIAAAAERDPYSGLFAVELPTGTLGYQYHGTGDGGDYSDSIHFDLGLHVGLVAYQLAYARRRSAEVAGVPEAGPLITFMGEGVKLRAGYVSVMGSELAHALRTSTCLGYLAMVCVDTRTLSNVYILRDRRERLLTNYVGISIGVGFSSGYEVDD